MIARVEGKLVAKDLDSLEVTVRYMKALSLLSLNKTELAIAEASRALASSPPLYDAVKLRWVRANALQIQGRKAESRQEFEWCLAHVIESDVPIQHIQRMIELTS